MSRRQTKLALMSKSLGYVRSLKSISREERGQQAFQSLGEDYNKLVRQTADSFPELVAFLPPEVSFQTGNRDGTRYSFETRTDIYVFSEAIFQLLSSIEADEFTSAENSSELRREPPSSRPELDSQP